MLSGVEVDNDATLVRYQQMAVVLARAGADMLGTSGMMDGQVGAVRGGAGFRGLRQHRHPAYAAKYTSALYGPFREAVDSSRKGTAVPTSRIRPTAAKRCGRQRWTSRRAPMS